MKTKAKPAALFCPWCLNDVSEETAFVHPLTGCHYCSREHAAAHVGVPPEGTPCPVCGPATAEAHGW